MTDADKMEWMLVIDALILIALCIDVWISWQLLKRGGK